MATPLRINSQLIRNGVATGSPSFAMESHNLANSLRMHGDFTAKQFLTLRIEVIMSISLRVE